MSLVFPTNDRRHLLHNFSCQLYNRHSSSPTVTCWRVLLQIAAPSVGLTGNTAGRTMLISVWIATRPWFHIYCKKIWLIMEGKVKTMGPIVFGFFFFFFLVSFCEVFGFLWSFFTLFYTPSNWPWCWDFNIFLPFWCLELLVPTATHLAGNQVFAGLAHQALWEESPFPPADQAKAFSPSCPMPCATDHQGEQQKSESLDSVSSTVISYILTQIQGSHNSFPSLMSKYKKIVIWKYFLNGRLFLKCYLTFAWRDSAPYYLVLTFNNICMFIELPLLYTAITGISWAGHVKGEFSIHLLYFFWKYERFIFLCKISDETRMHFILLAFSYNLFSLVS